MITIYIDIDQYNLDIFVYDTSGKAKFPKRRQKLVELTINRLMDKSSYVRANAIKVLTKFIETHPFVMDGGELSLSLFESKHQAITERLEVFDLQFNYVYIYLSIIVLGYGFTRRND